MIGAFPSTSLRGVICMKGKKRRKKKLAVVSIALLFLIGIALGVYYYYVNMTCTIRQFIVPSVYTIDLGILYSAHRGSDTVQKDLVQFGSYKTWESSVILESRLMNIDKLQSYFSTFKVYLEFYSFENREMLANYTLSYSNIEYSFVIPKEDFGSISISLYAEVKPDIDQHEIILKPFGIVELCP